MRQGRHESRSRRQPFTLTTVRERGERERGVQRAQREIAAGAQLALSFPFIPGT